MKKSFYALGIIGALSFFGCTNDGPSLLRSSSSSSSSRPTYKASFAKSSQSSTLNVFFSGTVTDSSGNVYVAGAMDQNSPVSFGNGVSAQGASTNENMILVKYDADGNALWAKSVSATTTSGDASTNLNGIGIGPDDSIYVAGKLAGDSVYNFGNGVTAQPALVNNVSFFIAKYDTNGNALWARTTANESGANYSNNGQTYFNGVSVGSDGSVYAMGTLTTPDNVSFGNGVFAAGNIHAQNMVAVKYDSSGVAQWAKTASATDESVAAAIAANANGVYLIGFANSTTSFNFGNSVVFNGASSASNAFIVKYSLSGTPQWVKGATSASDGTSFNSIALNTDGSIYVAGALNGAGTYNFGNGVALTAASNSSDALVLKYNDSGTAQWGTTVVNSSGDSSYSSIALSSSGIYVVGSLQGNTAFDFGNSITAQGAYSGDNMLFAKYDFLGKSALALTTVSANTMTRLSSVAISPNGDIYSVGFMYDNGTVGFGNSVSVTGGNANNMNGIILGFK